MNATKKQSILNSAKKHKSLENIVYGLKVLAFHIRHYVFESALRSFKNPGQTKRLLKKLDTTLGYRIKVPVLWKKTTQK